MKHYLRRFRLALRRRWFRIKKRYHKLCVRVGFWLYARSNAWLIDYGIDPGVPSLPSRFDVWLPDRYSRW